MYLKEKFHCIVYHEVYDDERKKRDEKKVNLFLFLNRIFILQFTASRIRPSQQIAAGNSVIRRETSFYDIMSNKILSTVYRTNHPYEQAMLLGKRSSNR